MIRILAGQIGRFAAMTVMMILLLLQQKQIQTRYTLHFDTANYLIISEVVSNIVIEVESQGRSRPCGLVKVADKSEIVRILAGQIRKFAAMADHSSALRGTFIRLLKEQRLWGINSGQKTGLRLPSNSEIGVCNTCLLRHGGDGGRRVARSHGFPAMADVIIGLCLNKGESELFLGFGLSGSAWFGNQYK
ncbi:hypothetical protein Tco_1482032 [Tanacetum coccineum]